MSLVFLRAKHFVRKFLDFDLLGVAFPLVFIVGCAKLADNAINVSARPITDPTLELVFIYVDREFVLVVLAFRARK